MAENEAVKSKRDLTLERMKSKYPDKQFDDDEALYGQINDDYDNYDKELSGYKQREQSMSDMFSADPRSALFLQSWRNGGNPAVELVRQFGPDFMEELQDPANQDKLAEAQKDYLDKVAKNNKLNKEYEKNFPESLALMDKLEQEEGIPSETMDKAFELLLQIANDGVVGKFSEGTIRLALNAINYDADVEDAGKAGEVRGRNANIKEKLRKPRQGDGTATLNGKNGDAASQHAPETFAGRPSIWDRGNVQRVKRS